METTQKLHLEALTPSTFVATPIAPLPSGRRSTLAELLPRGDTNDADDYDKTSDDDVKVDDVDEANEADDEADKEVADNDEANMEDDHDEVSSHPTKKRAMKQNDIHK
jgi:hypothetical protein